MNQPNAPQSTPKQALYQDVTKQIAATINGERNVLARLVTTISLLHHHMDYFFWTGVYLVDAAKKDELVIGPYQGTLGCLRIPFGKGVCGAAAARGESICVDNVHDFAGHIPQWLRRVIQDRYKNPQQ